MRIALRKTVLFIQKLVIATLIVPFGLSISHATPHGTTADKYAAIVVDANSGKTLYQYNANAKRYPASLTKMMTLYMLFEAMEQKRISSKTPIHISAYAASRPPTKIGLQPGQTIGAENAAKALITRSANDIAAAIAEYLGGSEERFAQMMTAKARRLGMMNTNFTNASGLPDAKNYSTARDMIILSIALREHFPRQYNLFKTTDFTYRGQKIIGHNKLVKTLKGVDGIKTGYVNMSGFNLATSLRIDGKSLVAVVMGGRTASQRDKHMADLLNRYIGKAHVIRKGPMQIANNTTVNPTTVSINRKETLLPKGQYAPIPVANTIIASNTVVSLIPSDQKIPVPVRKHDNINDSNIIVTALRSEPNIASIASVIAANNAIRTENVLDPITTASTTKETNSQWAIQIGSLPSEEQAKSLLNKAVESNTGRSVLAKTTAVTELFTKNEKQFYRARFTGFSNKDAAWSVCTALKKENFNCYAISH